MKTWAGLTLIAALLASSPSAFASTRIPDCRNGQDDDDDGLVDLDDRGCESDVDYFEGPMTAHFAREYAKYRISINWLAYNREGPVRTWIRCERQSSKSFRCRFRYRQRDRYSGVIRVYFMHFEDADGSGDLENYQVVMYRSSCDGLGYALPFAIRTGNLPCGRARRWIRDWYSHGQPMPNGYDCNLVAYPRTASCDGNDESYRKWFTFKYGE